MATQHPLFDDMEPKAIDDQTHPEEKRAFEYWLEKAGVPWAGLFASLLSQGFTWREAAVCAWSVGIEGERQPKTQGELAALLGCGPDTVSKHINKPKVQMMALAQRRVAFLPHLDEVMRAHLETVKMAGGRQTSERMRFMEEMGIYEPRQDGINLNVLQATLAQASGGEHIDLSQLTEEELRRKLGAIAGDDVDTDD